MSENNEMYYFVSNKNFDNIIVHPRIPIDKFKLEDSIIPRICVSKSLLGCINSTHIYERYKRIYVHVCESNDVITPTRKQVNDSYLTGEEWIIKPTIMKFEYLLHVKKEIINDQISYWKFYDKNRLVEFGIYGFDYNRFYTRKNYHKWFKKQFYKE